MNVNGSTTPRTFMYTVPGNGHLMLVGVNVVVMDTAVSPDNFGNRAELGNGVLVDMCDEQGVTQIDVTDGSPVVRNADWAAIDGGVLSRLPGATGELLAVRWTADPKIDVNLPGGWSFRMVVRDDLSSLALFRTFLKGRFVHNP